MDNQIASDENIQNEIASLNVTGSKVKKKMIIVPIKNTLLYVEPVYQTKLNESNVSILKKIIVASGNKMAIGNNLEEAVHNLISSYAVNIETETTDDIRDTINSIIKANKNLKESLNNNNWELMGSDIQKLQELIDSLDEQVSEEEPEDENDNIDEETQENVIDGNVVETQ